jgi:hypothetical protein
MSDCVKRPFYSWLNDDEGQGIIQKKKKALIWSA